MEASAQDIVSGIDAAGYTSVSGSELTQMVSAATPHDGIGFVLRSEDTGTVPEVPNAAVVVKWKSYLWKRITATSVILYVWNDNAASDVTFLKWQSISVASIGDGTITTEKLVDNAVTSAKILSLAWGKLTGIPLSFTPGGNAGGALTGTYPNPTLVAGVVDETALAANAVNIATKIKMTGATDAQLLRVKTDLSGLEYFTSLIAQLGLGTALQSIRVNVGATAWEAFTPAFAKSVYATLGASALSVSTSSATADYSENFAHGLAVVPNLVRVMFACITNDGTYTAGDEVPVDNVFNTALTARAVFSAAIDATNVKVMYSSGANGFKVRAKDNTGWVTITYANWKIKVYAAA